MNLRVRALILVGVLTVMQVGCGGSGSRAGTTPLGNVVLTVVWPTQPTAQVPQTINSVIITLGSAASQNHQPYTFTRRPNQAQAVATLPIAAGTLPMTAMAYASQDASGPAVASCAGSLVIAATGTTKDTFTVGTPITSLTLQPAAVAAFANSQTPVGIAGQDANRDVVLMAPTQVSWASSDPTVATVDPTGTSVNLTGMKVGSATLTATEQTSKLSISATVTVTAAGPSPWSRLRGDNANTGRGIGAGATGTWSFTLPVGMYGTGGPPAIGGDGTVYFGGAFDNTYYAYSSLNGALRWSFPTIEAVDAAPAIGTNGLVYLPSYDGNLYAVNTLTGKKVWSAVINAIKTINTSSPVIGSDGTVFVGAGNGKLYAFDGRTGNPKWVFVTGGAINGSPALGPDGTVYVGSVDKNLYALNPTSGAPNWTFAATGQINGSPSVGTNGLIYVTASDGSISAVNAATGTQTWVYSTLGTNIIGSPGIARDGTVYVWSHDQINNYVYALDGVAGSLKWASQLDSENDYASGGFSPIIASDGTIYITSQANLYALNPTSGSQIWSYSVVGLAARDPAIGSDGRLFLPTGNGLFVFQ